MSTAISSLPHHVRSKIADAQLPLKYTEAVRALKACTSIDEAKYWTDKADALAAWAKIYRNDDAAKEARRVKLHAYRRMAEIAEEIRPTEIGSKSGRRGGKPGASSLLKEYGLSHTQAITARRVASIPNGRFNRLIGRKDPPTIHQAAELAIGQVAEGYKAKRTAAYRELQRHSFLILASWIKTNPAKRLAVKMNKGETAILRPKIRALIDWLDELDQYLPKENGSRKGSREGAER